MHDERLLQNVAHGVPCIQRFQRVLEDHLDVLAQRAQAARAHLRDVLPGKVDTASRGCVEARDAAPERRFAAAGFAHQAEGFARVDAE